MLCLKGFQGYGYNEKFTKNMAKINHQRKLNTSIIKLKNDVDDICLACPNLKNNMCENQKQNQKIIKMDNEVLKMFENKEYNSNELCEKIDELFTTKENVSNICNGCKWHEKCLFYQNLK